MFKNNYDSTKTIIETWKRFMNEGIDITKQMTDLGHEAWRSDFIRDNGENTTRYKPVPEDTSLEDLQYQGYQGLVMIDDKVHQDINQPASNIIPSLNNKLNGKPAIGYNSVMNSITINSVEDIETIADEFHKVWMSCNSWQKEKSPEMFVDYSQLSRDLKIKDLIQVELAIKIMYGEGSYEHNLLNKAMQRV